MEVSTQIDGSGLPPCPGSWRLWSRLVYFLLSEGGSRLAGADVAAQLCILEMKYCGELGFEAANLPPNASHFSNLQLLIFP